MVLSEFSISNYRLSSRGLKTVSADHARTKFSVRGVEGNIDLEHENEDSIPNRLLSRNKYFMDGIEATRAGLKNGSLATGRKERGLQGRGVEAN